MAIISKFAPKPGGKKNSDAKKCVDKVKSDLSKYRKQFERNWQEEEEAYHGVIWKQANENRPYENRVFQIIEGEVPILTDSMPGTAVEVKDPAFIEQAKSLGKAIEWVYEDQQFNLMYSEVVRNSLISGPGFIYQYYDANACDGQGRIINEVLDWRQVFLSGRSRYIEDCDKARIELYRSKDWLKLNYPKYADEIDKLKGEEGFEKESTIRDRETYDSGYGPAKRSVPIRYKDEDTLKLIKTYKKDYSVIPIPEEETNEDLQKEAQSLAEGVSPDIKKWENHPRHIEVHLEKLTELYSSLELTPEAGFEAASELVEEISAESPEGAEQLGQILFQIKLLELHIEEHKALLKENPKGGRLKYPGGWRVIESIQNLILSDGACKDNHKEIPLVPFYCYRNGTIYGHGEIRNILDSQRMSAIMQYKEYKGLQKVANPEKEVNLASGLTAEDVTNEDGAIYEVKEGVPWTVRNLPPGQINNQIVNFQQDRLSNMRDISGMTEVTEGKVPHPNASGVTVTRTQRQAIGRIRLKDRQNQFYSIRRLGKLTASNILQYWTAEKVLRLENVGEESQQVIFNPFEMQDLEYEIAIAPGTIAGIDKEAMSAQLFQLLQAGHITFEEFLEVADIPKGKKILELASQRNQTNQQLQELQQQNIQLRGQIDRGLLNEEEQLQFDELRRQEELSQLVGVDDNQPT